MTGSKVTEDHQGTLTFLPQQLHLAYVAGPIKKREIARTPNSLQCGHVCIFINHLISTSH